MVFKESLTKQLKTYCDWNLSRRGGFVTFDFRN